jgi:hypothetical protein
VGVTDDDGINAAHFLYQSEIRQGILAAPLTDPGIKQDSSVSDPNADTASAYFLGSAGKSEFHQYCSLYL